MSHTIEIILNHHRHHCHSHSSVAARWPITTAVPSSNLGADGMVLLVDNVGVLGDFLGVLPFAHPTKTLRFLAPSSLYSCHSYFSFSLQ